MQRYIEEVGAAGHARQYSPSLETSSTTIPIEGSLRATGSPLPLHRAVVETYSTSPRHPLLDYLELAGDASASASPGLTATPSTISTPRPKQHQPSMVM